MSTSRYSSVTHVYISQGFFRNSTGHGGNIWVYDYLKAESIRPLKLVKFENKRSSFHPLGIEYWAPTNTLYVINHGPVISEIEIFSVDFAKSTATYIRSFAHSMMPYPNSLALIGKDEFLITNDHIIGARVNKVLSQIETYLSPSLATVLHVELESGKVTVSRRVAWANGITFVNSTTIAVASTSKPGVYLFSFNPDTKKLKYQSLISLSFFPDNLSTDSRGKLLIAGHPHPPSLEKVSKTNHLFELDGGKDDVNRPRAPSHAVEWDGFDLKDIYVDDGTEFGCSSTVVLDSQTGVGIVTGLYEKGILVWRSE